MNKLKTIRKEGHSKVIAVTNIFPNDWKLITATIVTNSKRVIVVQFDKVS